MVEAPNHSGLHPTSISHVYKVFQHLDRLWMGIWVHPNSTKPVQVRMDFRRGKLGMVDPKLCCTIVVEAQTTVDGIPHPYHMYTKCFSTLICCGWAYGSTLTMLLLCQVGLDFRKIGLWLSPSDVVRSWLSFQTHMECIPHPYYMCTKCFITWIGCGWAYGSTLVLYCAGEEGFQENWGMVDPK